MSENKIRDISNISNSTVIIGDNNQSTNNTTCETIFLEAKELIDSYEEEQKEKKKQGKKKLVPALSFFGAIFLISIVCCFLFPKETLLTIMGFAVSVIGAGLSLYSYFDNLRKPNQTQRDYFARYCEIVRILNYHRRKDLVSELADLQKGIT